MAEWWRGSSRSPRTPPSALRAATSPRNLGKDVRAPGAVQPHPFRAVCSPSARRRLDRFLVGAARHVKAAALGARADGDPGERARASAGAALAEPHSCRDVRREGRAVGDGGGLKMPGPLCRHRRDLGRPACARFHRDAAACRRFRALWRGRLSDSARWPRQFERRQDALADRKRAVARQRARPKSAGTSGMGRRVVPRARNAVGPLERRL